MLDHLTNTQRFALCHVCRSPGINAEAIVLERWPESKQVDKKIITITRALNKLKRLGFVWGAGAWYDTWFPTSDGHVDTNAYLDKKNKPFIPKLIGDFACQASTSTTMADRNPPPEIRLYVSEPDTKGSD